ncbi:MAG: tetratricopeptide repeat protein, partial [Fibrobacterota bacterium]
MNSKVTSILILLVFFSFPLKADLAESLLKNGNREYTEKNYTAAAEEYRKIISMGVHNSTVYYNLGNALYRSGELGRALLAYEKAF